jgi:phage gp29-like protein
MMKITLQNNKYVATAISNVTGVAIRELVYMADPEDNLVITHPENVDISSVESEILNVKTTMDLTELRTQRDKIIAGTDWWVMPDRTATDEQRAYRQALRDITDTYTSLEDVVWPTKPE